MKIARILPISLIFLSSSILADDLKMKMLGGFDFQAGYITSNAPGSNPNDALANPNFITNNQKRLGFATSASFGVEVKETMENGFIYGAKLGLETTTKSSRKIQSGIFTETEVGKLEAGSDSSAMSKMRITAYSVTAATKGGWDAWVTGDPTSYKDSNKEKVQIPYITNFTNFLDSKLRESGKIEYSRKITYYTPEFSGFQIGISYVPDSSNVGYSDQMKDDKIKQTPVVSPYYFRVKNGVAGGITYKNIISDKFTAKISAVGETGRVKGVPKHSPTPATNNNIKHLNNYTLGTQLDYDQFSFSGSYGNYLKSFTLNSEKARRTELFGAGISYKFGDIKTSIVGMTSKHRHSNMDSGTLAIEYKLAPGMMPYAEATYFNFSGRNVIEDNNPKNKHKGGLFVVGARIEI